MISRTLPWNPLQIRKVRPPSAAECECDHKIIFRATSRHLTPSMEDKLFELHHPRYEFVTLGVSRH
jgi:hypothetical protein